MYYKGLKVEPIKVNFGCIRIETRDNGHNEEEIVIKNNGCEIMQANFQMFRDLVSAVVDFTEKVEERKKELEAQAEKSEPSPVRIK